MRMRDLEQLLIEKVIQEKWIRKYGEEESFGALKSECRHYEEQSNESSGDDDANNVKVQLNNEKLEKELAESIKINPLL